METNNTEYDQYRLLESLPFGKTLILGKEYTHLNVQDSMLDSQFVKMASQVESDYKTIMKNNRQESLRLEAWLKKLSEMLCCERVPLLKNRNNYMKLLQRCLGELGTLEGVFRKMPPQGAQELRTLQKHEILEIDFAVKAALAKRKAEDTRKQAQVQIVNKKRKSDEAQQRKSIEKYYQQLD